MKSPRFAVSILAVLFVVSVPSFSSQAPPGTVPPAKKKAAPPAQPAAKAAPKAAPKAAAPAAAAPKPPSKAATTAAVAKAPAKTPPKAAPKTTSKAAPKGGVKTVAATPRGRQRKPVVRRPPVQAVPAPDRVKEIQEALAGHGYTTPVDGVWGKETETAMAKFQQDQNLEGRGKLTALSLIALGLGPQKEPAAKPAPEKD